MIKTNKEDVKKIVKKELNSEISNDNISKCIKATTHEVYIITVKDSKYALRIAIKDKPKFYTEIWALKNQKKLNIKAPKLIKWDDSKSIVPFRFTLEEFIEGTHVSKDNKDKMSKAYNQLSREVLHKIHKQKIVGFGPLNDKGKGEHKTWSDFLEFKYQKAFPQLERLQLLPKKELESISSIHKKYLPKIKIKSSKLILGDLHPKNFFLKNDKFHSFVDLKSVMGGDPIWEYSLISYYLDLKIWPNYIKETNSARRRYYFYLINIAINKIWFSHKANHPTSKIKKQLKKYIKEIQAR